MRLWSMPHSCRNTVLETWTMDEIKEILAVPFWKCPQLGKSWAHPPKPTDITDVGTSISASSQSQDCIKPQWGQEHLPPSTHQLSGVREDFCSLFLPPCPQPWTQEMEESKCMKSKPHPPNSKVQESEPYHPPFYKSRESRSLSLWGLL